jgi:hypothetical protein
MSEELETAKRYRQHAEELRIIAADEANRESRSALERIAKDYENLANTMEAIDKTNRARRGQDGSD